MKRTWVFGRIVAGDGTPPFRGAVVVEDGRIADVIAAERADLPDVDPALATDAGDAYVTPGFVDLHVHGGAGADVMDGDPEALAVMCRHHLAHGTTSLLLTTMTAPKGEIDRALAAADAFRRTHELGGMVLGVHLEGPFISERWPGAQNPAHVSPARVEWVREWTQAHPGLVRLLTLAPETEGAEETVRYAVGQNIVAACGHSDATYEQMTAAIAWGVSHSVHCCNGMRPFHHREPGVVGAVLLHPELSTELILDGHHLHQAAAELVRKVKGDRVCLVTDAIRASGMPDGEYELGGLRVTVRDGVARTESGSLAGSSLTMSRALANLVRRHGTPIHEAIRHVTSIPAGIAGTANKGRIAPGADADLVVLAPDTLEPRDVMLGGRWMAERLGTVKPSQ